MDPQNRFLIKWITNSNLSEVREWNKTVLWNPGYKSTCEKYLSQHSFHIKALPRIPYQEHSKNKSDVCTPTQCKGYDRDMFTLVTISCISHNALHICVGPCWGGHQNRAIWEMLVLGCAEHSASDTTEYDSIWSTHIFKVFVLCCKTFGEFYQLEGHRQFNTLRLFVSKIFVTINLWHSIRCVLRVPARK